MNDKKDSDFLSGPRLAVLIGIDKYRNGISELRNARNDVDAVGRVLHREHGYPIRRLVDSEATLAGLRALFAELAKSDTPIQRLIIYFAGHGVALETEEDQDGPQGYLLPQDAHRDDVTTYLAMRELQQSLLAIKECSHLLLLLDCCFAGAFRWSTTRSLVTKPARLYKERFDRYVRESAWQVITSSAHDERALDRPSGPGHGRTENSPFAAALCEGLSGAADLRVGDRPGDGVIVASELHFYLESQFAQLERQGVAQPAAKQLQRPMFWSLAGRDKGNFIFVVPGRSAAMLESALALNEKNNPYRGLDPYERSHAALFFGRQEATAKLLEHVYQEPLTVVLGISGSGKTSLVQAGLLPRISEQPDWRILPVLRPGAKPLAELSTVSAALGTPELDLPAAVAAACRGSAVARLLLVIDQLEELVTMESAVAERERFFAQLRLAQESAGGQLRIVMALRSDFESHFTTLFPEAVEAQARFQVRVLGRDELREVIEGPAGERVLHFEPPALVNRLLDEVADLPAALPVLSFALSEMYCSFVKRSPDDRALRPEDMAHGGVSGAFSRWADEIYGCLDAEHQMVLRHLMLRLIAREGGGRARRRVMRAELQYDGPQAVLLLRVLDRMLESRLLVSGTDADGAPYVELAHDTLIQGWSTLSTFIEAERDTLPLQHRLAQTAKDWGTNARDPRRLWTQDPRLPQILALWREQPGRFNVEESSFIKESVTRRRRRLALLSSVVVSIVVVLSGITLYALSARQRAITAQQEERKQRTTAELAQQAEREQRTTAELAQYRAQLRAAAASVEAKQLPTARQILFGADPAYRGWEWAYLLVQAGPRPMPLDEFPESDELRTILEELPAIDADFEDEESEDKAGKINVPSEQASPGVLSIALGGGKRSGVTLTIKSGASVLLTIEPGLYGRVSEPQMGSDGSVLVVDIDCGLTQRSSCETSAGDVLSRDVYVLCIPPAPVLAVKQPPRLLLSADQRALLQELEADPEPASDEVLDPARNPFEQWLTCDGKPCALLMKGGTAKSLWQLSPLKHLRTLELPDDTRQAVRPLKADGEEKLLKTNDGYDHAGCVSADGQRIFGFPFGPDRNAAIFDVTTGRLLVIMKSHSGKPAQGVGGELATYGSASCAFSPSGREVARASIGKNFMELQIWDVVTGAELYPPPPSRPNDGDSNAESEFPDAPLGVAWDPTGTLFALYNKDRSLKLYDHVGGRQLASFQNQKLTADAMELPAFRMLLSPDKKRLLIGTLLVDVVDPAILFDVSADIHPNWRSFTTTKSYSLAFWDAYRKRPGTPLSLGDRLLLWQVAQADEQRAQSAKR